MKNNEKELRIMALALPVIEAVPSEQDECWPGDPSHDDHCSLTDHAESVAAVKATEGVSWEFRSWSSTHAAWRSVLDEAVSEFVNAYEDDDEIPIEELERIFVLAYERTADDSDRRTGLWSLICAAA
ncbi:MAG TPA: hypothetical protein PLY56_18945 [Armatimonadota bacterium]|nr:hypothetical protein [Armatimonadota bacterium]